MSALDNLSKQAEAELARLSKPKRDFTAIGEQIVASLRKAANDQILEAQNLAASVEVLAEGILAQMAEHAKMLDEMDDRMKAFGADVVDAHKRFLNGGKHENPSP